MAKIINPLAFNVPIVDPKTGFPTEYFKRILEDISEARVSSALIDALGGDPDENQVVTWNDSVGDLEFTPMAEALDQIDNTHGAILYRDSADWQALAPGTDGDVLTTHGASADPTWETPSGSGGVLVYSFFNDITAGFTLNINTTTYTALLPFILKLPYDTFPATHFRLGARIASNAAGQTVSCQLTNGGTPLHTGGNDVTGITNTNTTVDTGWLTIDIALSGLQQLNLEWKGSNSTVDVVMVQPFYIMFK